MMNTGRRNAGQPRLKRDGVTLLNTANPVASSSRSDVQEVFGQHLRRTAKIPSSLCIEDQNRGAGVFSEFIWTGVVVRSQSPKSPVRQFPIYGVGAPPASLEAMHAFVLADVYDFADLASPNDETARGRTWAKAHYPFAHLRTGSDLGFACCQRHQPMIDARCHPGIVL